MTNRLDDGTLKMYAPDDVYIIAGARALLELRRAVDDALHRYWGETVVGQVPDEWEGRALIIVRMDAEEDRYVRVTAGRSPQEKPQPALAGVDRGYW